MEKNNGEDLMAWEPEVAGRVKSSGVLYTHV